jgi:6-phosphogluconolactonase
MLNREQKMNKSSSLAKLLFLMFALVWSLNASHQSRGYAGAVYTMTNDAVSNSVLVFHRKADGSLIPGDSVATGGQGSGGGLGNQGSVVLSQGDRWLFAVNAGSSEVSAFKVTRTGLVLTDKVSSGGIQPISLTVHRDLLYVLNAGGAGNISGFRVSHRGKLSPLAGSIQPLSGAGTDPAAIAFSPWRNVLVVTEKATNQILTYTVGRDDLASGPMVHASSGATPFGFDFGKRGVLLVTEAAGGSPAASSVSSYRVSANGNLEVITASAPTNQTAACWLVVTRDGRYAFTSNTPNDSLSTYGIEFDGEIELQETTTVPAGAQPLDSALTGNSRYLYVLNSGNGSLGGFRVRLNGQLTSIAVEIDGLPTSANGIAAR